VTLLYLYDDARARTFEPFALTRPLGEMRAGVELIRKRWEVALGLKAAGAIAAAHLAEFEEFDAPPVVLDTVPAGAVVANTRCVAPLVRSDGDWDVWTCGGCVAAVRLTRPVAVSDLADGEVPLESLAPSAARATELRGRWMDELWSFIVHLLEQLHEDITAVGPRLDCSPPEQAIILGEHPVYVERGATVEPAVCFDVSAGPVLVRAAAAVRAFTRLVGPCAIAGGANVLGDRVHGCAIGETTVVRGELSETIVLGHANKAHDGFVGHSYLGRWVNLGAGTITSNLKNSYGTVRVWTPEGTRDTGVNKLGSFFGDHVKTGIGTRLTTGSVIGAGSNIFGAAMPPKYVPPFSWGEGEALSVYRLEEFLRTAQRAMARRSVALTERTRQQLAAAHARSRGAVR
jgi:UDP-N-acetylglucosamine diphosphorylase/glucosamine-1-phosphate N-acetyltransferase